MTSSRDTEPLILVIDDDPLDQCFVKRTLRRIDGRIAVKQAMDGETGLAMAERLCPDLVILDVDMPGFDGFDVMSRLAERSSSLSSPVVMMSSSDRAEDAARATSLGAARYVTKPWNGEEYLTIASELLQDYLNLR